MTAGAQVAMARGALVGAIVVGIVAAAIGIALAALAGGAPSGVAASAAPGRVGSIRALPSLDGFIGRSFFEDPWIAAPASTTLRDGLGPLYNAHACASCHRAAARVAARAAAGATTQAPTGMVLRVGRRAGESFVADPVYGDTIQRRSVRGVASPVVGEARWSLGHVVEEVDDGLGAPRRLLRPEPRLEAFAYGDPGPGLLASLRIAPALAGVGRIERVADATLLALEDPGDRDGDGISGRVHRLAGVDGGEPRIGRFGHKAVHPSLARQVGAALRDDIGITSRLFPAETCTPAQADCARAPGGAGPDGPHEIPDGLLDALVAHVASLAPPPARSTRSGDRLFRQAGCAACHIPLLPGIGGEAVALYSDLLLHDMGDGLADALGEGDATGAEWRTAPLVGIGGREHDGLLHDGRARGLVEAILWHGGEAAPARERFRAMDEPDRGALLDYLRAL